MVRVANLAERQGYQPLLDDDGAYSDYLGPGDTDAAQGLDRPASNISTRVPFNRAVMVGRILFAGVWSLGFVGHGTDAYSFHAAFFRHQVKLLLGASGRC